MFFIVGSSRSGTTLLSSVLSKNAAVFVSNETPFWELNHDLRKNFASASSQQLISVYENLWLIHMFGLHNSHPISHQMSAESKTFAKEAYQSYLDLNQTGSYKTFIETFYTVLSAKPKATVLGDQTPRNAYYIQDIWKEFVMARFIFMVRNPYDICLSQKNKWQHAKRKNSGLLELLRTYFNYHPLTNALLWRNTYNKYWTNSESELVMFQKYEELVNDPTASIQKVCEFLNIEHDDAMLEVNVINSSNIASGKVKGFSKASIGKGVEELSKGEIALINFILRKHAPKFGYTLKNVNWQTLSIIKWVTYFPLHLIASFSLNAGRFGNIFSYISKRIN